MFAHNLGRGSGRRTFPLALSRRPKARLALRPVILFVEDHATLRFTVTSDLEDAGYKVIEATRGDEAIDILIGGTKLDVLLTDLRLPGAIDGWDVAERARQLRPDLPVIYASAYSYVTPRQVPGSVMLDKPYRPEQLLDALDNLLV